MTASLESSWSNPTTTIIAKISNKLTIVILIVIQRSREHPATFETERRNKRSLDGQSPRARFQHKGDWAEIKADDEDGDDDIFFSNSKPFRPLFSIFRSPTEIHFPRNQATGASLPQTLPPFSDDDCRTIMMATLTMIMMMVRMMMMMMIWWW